MHDHRVKHQAVAAFHVETDDAMPVSLALDVRQRRQAGPLVGGAVHEVVGAELPPTVQPPRKSKILNSGCWWIHLSLQGKSRITSVR
jgi:hypothetical protein